MKFKKKFLLISSTLALSLTPIAIFTSNNLTEANYSSFNKQANDYSKSSLMNNQEPRSNNSSSESNNDSEISIANTNKLWWIPILAVVLSAVLVLLFVLAIIYKKKVMLCNTKFEYILEYW